MRKVFVDTETNSLRPGNIGQIAMIIQEDDGNISGYNQYFEVPFVSQSIIDKFNRDVAYYHEKSQGIRFIDKAPEIYNILNNSVFIAHNSKFDKNFVSMELQRCRLDFNIGAEFDTMEQLKEVVKVTGRNGRIKNPSLDNLIDFYSIDKNKIEAYCQKLFGCSTEGAHDAMFDVTAMFIVFRLYDESRKGEDAWTKLFQTS